MKAITIEGQERKELGKKSSKSIRKNDEIPCVLYGGESNIHFYAKRTSFVNLIYTPEFYKVILKLEGKEYQAILKDIQEHPVTEKILHIDFQELTVGKPVTTEIPVKLVGLAPGVQDGGRQILKIRKLKVRTLPKDLMEHVEVDVSEVVLGQSIKVGDLDLKEYELLDSDSSPIVTVEVQRLMKEDRILEAEAEALAAEEAAEAALLAEAEGIVEGEGDKPEGDKPEGDKPEGGKPEGGEGAKPQDGGDSPKGGGDGNPQGKGKEEPPQS